ncbi:unnamed protein product [Rotaria magnacalcarata]|uniref:Neurotransmitter-gated ion-channel ligand-binding domain-containing protein n=1 Tax=Rotaria magnacalcarata TaxID=392030 RepID=A0A820E2A5_9BILA|nr:unnamed protein product [Rotaria magnacalcarata]
MIEKRMQICLLILFFFLNLTLGGQYERRLLKTLFVKQQHNPFERPAKSDSASVSVDLRFSLLNLIEFNTQNKILTASFWMTQSWNDYSMTWKSKDYGNISELRVPSKNIWLPDIVLYNSIDSNDDNDMKRNVVISHDGKVFAITISSFVFYWIHTFASSNLDHGHSIRLESILQQQQTTKLIPVRMLTMTNGI